MKEKALTKMIVFWKIPQKGHPSITFYSYDKKRDFLSNNRVPGMNALENRIINNPSYMGKYNCAVIYDNQTGEELIKFNSEGVAN